MQIALVDNVRTLPSPGLKGLCPLCADPMIAKCGTLRIHHWAHKAQLNCDPWWERETEWHRTWKGHFPESWREVIAHDEIGEKHIADVRTEHGLVIEVQHSHLSEAERQARERFYETMIWIVDGTRLIRDYPRFLACVRRLLPSAVPRAYLLPYPDGFFPKSWLTSTVPVVFDFRQSQLCGPDEENREWLWCLLPGRVEGHAVIARMSRQGFIEAARLRQRLIPAHIYTRVTVGLAEQRERELAEMRRAYQARRSLERYGSRRYARF